MTTPTATSTKPRSLSTESSMHQYAKTANRFQEFEGTLMWGTPYEETSPFGQELELRHADAQVGSRYTHYRFSPSGKVLTIRTGLRANETHVENGVKTKVTLKNGRVDFARVLMQAFVKRVCLAKVAQLSEMSLANTHLTERQLSSTNVEYAFASGSQFTRVRYDAAKGLLTINDQVHPPTVATLGAMPNPEKASAALLNGLRLQTPAAMAAADRRAVERASAS